MTYQEKQYEVSELQKVKATVLSECQRLVRETVYKSKEYDGADIALMDDEKSFIIEPL